MYNLRYEIARLLIKLKVRLMLDTEELAEKREKGILGDEAKKLIELNLHDLKQIENILKILNDLRRFKDEK